MGTPAEIAQPRPATAPAAPPADELLTRPLAALPAPVKRDASPEWERRIERFVVRVRGYGCGTGWTGSGFAVSDTLIATNRHVVAGADRLEVNTFDGRRRLVVDAVAVPSPYADLALIRVQDRLPRVARTSRSLRRREPIIAIGFPRGGELQFLRGRIAGTKPAPDGDFGRVLRITAKVTHGSSGGPVVDLEGRVVGVVYRLDDDPRYRLAIPISRLGELFSAAVPAQQLSCY